MDKSSASNLLGGSVYKIPANIVSGEVGVIAILSDKHYYEAEVDYSYSLNQHIMSLEWGGAVKADHDLRISNLVGGSVENWKVERSFGLVLMSKLCSAETIRRKISQLGWCLVDYHEAFAFGGIYQAHDLEIPVVALDVLFQIPTFGNHSLVFNYNYEMEGINLDLKQLRADVPTKYFHLVVKNEAIYPIM